MRRKGLTQVYVKYTFAGKTALKYTFAYISHVDKHALCLNRDREAKSLESSVFPPVVPHTFFNPDWNMARVASRGAEILRVETRVTVDALKLRIR